MSNNNPKTKLKEFIASGCYTGYVPFIPGTAAAIIGIIIYTIIVSLLNETIDIVVVLALVIAILMTVTMKLYQFSFDKWKSHDAKEFVLDEIIGMLTTLLFVHWYRGIFNFNPDGIYKWKIIIPCFILFRLFDIIKVFPANVIDDMSGSNAVIFDDVISAAWAALIVVIFIT
jgi:phosphatidylglycerophosphatase A